MDTQDITEEDLKDTEGLILLDLDMQDCIFYGLVEDYLLFQYVHWSIINNIECKSCENSYSLY